MSFVSLQEHLRRTYLEALGSGGLTQFILNQHLKAKPVYKNFDGYIHASSLDWSKTAEQQVAKLINPNHRGTENTRGPAEAGDLYHADLHRKFDQEFGVDGAWKEFPINMPEFPYRGHVDRIQVGTPVGNILFEWKTINRYGQDKAGREKLTNTWYKDKHRRWSPVDSPEHKMTLGDVLTICPTFSATTSEMIERLNIRKIDPIEKSEHATQAFTYASMLYNFMQQYGGLHWVVLTYIYREDYSVAAEYVYNLQSPTGQEKLRRAYTNLLEVRQCLLNHLAQRTT